MCIFLLLEFILRIFPGVPFNEGSSHVMLGSAKGCIQTVVIIFFFKVFRLHDD